MRNLLVAYGSKWYTSAVPLPSPATPRMILVHLGAFLALTAAQEVPAIPAPADLKVMAWNIWHGGREDGPEVGPARVVDVIRASGADLVAMQETYGSGELISEALGFHFHPRGTNVSIHSRYPIVEDLSVFEEFQCVGALIELPDSSRVAFYSIWLPYDAEIWAPGTRDASRPETMLAACQASAKSLDEIWSGIRKRLSDPKYADVSIVVAGDFNSMSHFDYGEVGFDQYEAVVVWPTSQVLTRAGFRDSYRECNPRIDRTADSTWTPRFPEQEQDRIDFVYYRSTEWRAAESRVLRDHPDGFPSDHAALLSVLRKTDTPLPTEQRLRAVTYNIHHGEGMDGEVDIARTGSRLRELRPDFLCLQEVDLRVDRSGSRNQALDLATSLEMHPAFGTFMEFQGGRYGLATLSRYPIVDAYSLALPEGNEPRVALIVETRLPDGETILLVNVHFDWVADDAFRFAQASQLAGHLRTLEKPYLLLGDFNDQPGSRTLELFHDLATEAPKPASDRLTFSSTAPEREIDFVFYSPAARWQVESTRVADEPLISDHRPVVTELLLRAQSTR